MKQRAVIGGLLGIAMIFSFAAGAVTVQALDKLIPIFQLNFIRITSKKIKPLSKSDINNVRGRPLMIWGAEEESNVNLFFLRECLLRIIFPGEGLSRFIFPGEGLL